MNPLTGKETPIQVVLAMLAAQEGCDGEPYDQMQMASEHIIELEARLAYARQAQVNQLIQGLEDMKEDGLLDFFLAKNAGLVKRLNAALSKRCKQCFTGPEDLK